MWRGVVTFIGDRFVSVGHNWLDIVTGTHVALRAGAPPLRLEARERACRERWAVIGAGTRLVDFGRQGSVGWFEAESAMSVTPPAPLRQLMWPQAAELADAIADGRATGRVRVAAPAGAGFQMFCQQFARCARDAGFVTVRADVPIPFRLRRQLTHRHVVLLAPTESSGAFAAGWLSQLAMVSDRRHVVIERAREDSAACIRLTPFSEERLIEAAGAGGRDEFVNEAAARSGGWPAAFVRQWSTLSPANVVRERARAFFEAAAPQAVTRDLARAMTYARRKRPAAESQWHSAVVAAAARRGDHDGAVRAAERWVERLVDQGRFARAVDVATRTLADSPQPNARHALTVLAARAHLASGGVTRAETLIAAAIAIERANGGEPTAETTELQFEVMFWKGRWQEIRAALNKLTDPPGFPNAAQWREFLDWADRGEISPDAVETSGADLFRPPLGRERGLAHAIAIAIRRSMGQAEPDEIQWLDDLVRRERLRGMARFSQGKSTMQMLRDMATLLEIVQTSEDETAGLERVCEWVRTAAGASACAVVTTAGTVVAGEALKAFGVDAQGASRWSERIDATCDEFEDAQRATAHAAIRFAGATVAVIAATGPAGSGRAFLHAVQAASAVCGSLVRSKLDAMAASAHGERLAGEILGTSPAIRSVRAAVARVAMAPFPVVIEGESGTGKELVARALHRHSPRRDRTFAALNCAALTDELIEAELFGHARGAFTHAVNARTGLFEDAHRGTLFLDEVGELSPRAQAKLLRTLQEGEIRRVGENDARAVDVRVIAATNRPLATLAAEGRFREDLMFRLSVVKIAVPPLRDRSEDVAQLAFEFWRASARRVGTLATLGPDAIALLTQMPWPGNVRQLQNAMAALSVAAPKTGRVGARLVRMVLDDLVDAFARDIVPLEEARRQVERRVVAAALAKHTGNRANAARALGLSRQGLAKALRRLGLAEAGAA